MGTGSRLIDAEEQGYDNRTEYACSQCVGDDYLSDWVRTHGGANFCDYCNQMPQLPERTVLVNNLAAILVAGIYYEHEPAAESAPVEHGVYQITTGDGLEVLEGELTLTCSQLVDDLVDMLSPYHDALVRKDWRGDGRDDQLVDGWREFQRAVGEERRFTFLRVPQSDKGSGTAWSDIPIEEVPDSLSQLIKELDLVTTMPAGTQWWRARAHSSSETCSTAKSLGAPPHQMARDNRMAPKGIAVFSGSSDQAGAEQEVLNYTDTATHPQLTVGRFRQTRDLRLVDLTTLPPWPSLFDLDRRHLRAPLRFLGGFIADLTQTSQPDDTQNLLYIPSQIVAEHLRYALPTDGIMWTSTQNPGSIVCAIFTTNDQMADIGETPSHDSTMQLIEASTQPTPSS